MTNTKTFTKFLLFGLITFSIDLITSFGFGIWSAYIILLVLYVKFAGSYKILHLAFVYLVFIIAGYIFSPSGALSHVAFINRGASLVIIFIVILLARRENEVREMNSEILTRMSDSVIAMDLKWNITYFSSALMKNMQIHEDPCGKNMWEAFPTFKNTILEKKYIESLEQLKPLSFNSVDLFPGREFRINTYPSKTGLTVYSQDITDLTKKEKELQKLLHQKEILIKEIHHRVKNNFQLVSSFINLSGSLSQTVECSSVLTDIETRIQTLALIHEKLYKSSDGTKINLKPYLEDLLNQLTSVFNSHAKNISHEIIFEQDVIVQIDSAIPIGLIINELYSNSIKHGFRNKQNGKVELTLNSINNDNCRLEIKYRDDGVGFQNELLKSESLGLAIIKSYVEQSNGTINSSSNGEGVEYSIKLDIS